MLMVFGVLCRASGVDVMGYTLGVRKTEEEVEVRLRRAVVKLSGTSLAELCSRDRRSTKKSRCCYDSRQARPGRLR